MSVFYDHIRALIDPEQSDRDRVRRRRRPGRQRDHDLGQLAAGASVDEVLADYPYLEREDILSALECAAAAAQERELAVVAPAA